MTTGTDSIHALTEKTIYDIFNNGWTETSVQFPGRELSNKNSLDEYINITIEPVFSDHETLNQADRRGIRRDYTLLIQTIVKKDNTGDRRLAVINDLLEVLLTEKIFPFEDSDNSVVFKTASPPRFVQNAEESRYQKNITFDFYVRN